jgi:glucose 1-dehydrogenase
MLKDKIAVVTGSSGGIGKAIAIAMAQKGAKVVVNYSSSEEEALEAVKEIKKYSDGIAIKANVASESDMQNLIDVTIDTFGRLDIMVCNAGIQVDSPFLKMDLTQWQKVIDVNLTGQFIAMNLAAKQFMKQETVKGQTRGNIIAISSVHDMIPWAGHVNYAASKGGVLMLMKSVAQELAPLGIRVNAISPGAIQTNINKSAWSDTENMEKLLDLIPYKRIGQPEDVAKAACWLASSESDYIIGETTYIDGGMMLYPEFADNG